MKKHAPLLFFGIISVLAILTLLTTIDFAEQFGPAIITPTQSSAPKTIMMSMPFGGRLGQFVPGLSDATVSGLARGVVQTGEGRSYYTQSMQFNVQGFQGFSSDFRSDYTQLGSSPEETLFCMGGSQDVWMQYRIDFESGLRSTIQNAVELSDYDNEQILLLGGIFTFVGSTITAQAPNGILELRLMGPGGLIILQDNPYDTAFTTFGLKVNGVNVNVDVQMMGSMTGTNKFVLSNIILRFRCEGLTGELLVPKMSCVSQRLGYPIFNPDFDLCYLGMGTGVVKIAGGVTADTLITGAAAVSGADFKIEHSGGRQLYITGEGYKKVPLFYLQGGQLMPGKDATQATWWVEQGAGANWIRVNDNFILNDRPNDDRAKVKVYQFRGADTNNNNLEIRDFNGKTHTIPYDPATGDCINRIQNYGTGAICNYNAATGRLAVDQNNDGTYNGQARWIISNRFIIVNLGNQFPGAATTITYTTLSRRIPEGGGNVVVQTSITGNDPIEQRITSPGTCPLTGDYNYGCMSLRAGTPFNLNDREHGGNIYVGGNSVPGGIPGAQVTVGSTQQPTTVGQTYTGAGGGRTGIILTFEASKLRGY